MAASAPATYRVPASGQPQPTTQPAARRKLLMAAACVGVVAAAAVSVVMVSGANSRAADRESSRRIAAAKVCSDAVSVGEDAAQNSANAVEALASAVAAFQVGTSAVQQRAAAVTDADRVAQPALTECMTSTAAPSVCTHAAAVLIDVASQQQAQAVTLTEIAAAASRGDAKTAAADLANLQRQTQQMLSRASQVGAADCQQAANLAAPSASTSAPEPLPS